MKNAKTVGREKKKKEKKTQTPLPGFELAFLCHAAVSFMCQKLNHAAKETKNKTRFISEYYVTITYTCNPLSEKETLLKRFQIQI